MLSRSEMPNPTINERRLMREGTNGSVPEPEAAFETITPEIAKDLLSSEFENRTLSQMTIKHLAREMAERRFVLNGETIVLGPNWELLDGQQRLHACIKAGVPFKTLVVYNIPVEAFKTLDQGKKRTAGDILGTRGYSSGNILAATVRWMMALNAGHPAPNYIREPNYVIADMAENYPGLGESIARARGARHIGAPISVVAAFHYVFSEIDEQEADRFVEDLITGEALSRNDAVKWLRERFMRQDKKNKMTPTEHAALIIRAWNARRTGREMKQLKGQIYLKPGDSPKLPKIM